MDLLSPDLVNEMVAAALAEDIGEGDATTLAIIPPESRSTAKLVAREPLVVAGLDFADAAFRRLSGDVRIRHTAREGQHVSAGRCLLEIEGSTRALLTAERVALNFVQRLSGVATFTAQFVAAIEGTSAQILDTRKTTPGWRLAEKHAVKCGGALNHRFGLFDLIMVKDNHLAALRDAKPNSVAAAVRLARGKFPDLRVEVEADSIEQVRQAADAGADIVLLDNMTTDQLREAVKLVNGRCETEASGGVTLDTIRAIAETGVDYISVGALTHSARAMDVALDVEG